MQEFKSWKRVMKDSVKSLAKDLAWKSLSKEERKSFLILAKEKQDKKLKVLAFKCVKEANETMSKPGYVSRADPTVYKN